METGSISDWISSISTAGTLLVACMAYKKAPSWFDSKHNEARFDYAMNIRECFEKTYLQLDNVLHLAEIAESQELIINDYATAHSQIYADILNLRQLLSGCSKYNLEPNPRLSGQALSLLNFVSTLPHAYFNLTKPKPIKDKINDYLDLKKKCEDVSNLQIDVLFNFLDKKK